MEENSLNKLKFNSFNCDTDNFVVDAELTVTITLSEYRDLVSIKATKDVLVKQAETDKWAREQENKALKEENAKLKGENYDLLQKLSALSGIDMHTEPDQEGE
jgi:cell division protein FtsB